MEHQTGLQENQQVEKSAHAETVAKRVHQILNVNIGKIKNVNHWAEMCGCSRCWLSRCIKSHFGKTPNELLREARYNAIISFIMHEPNALAVYAANNVAPHWCEKRLNSFLYNYKNTSFTKLRYKIMSQV